MILGMVAKETLLPGNDVRDWESMSAHLYWLRVKNLFWHNGQVHWMTFDATALEPGLDGLDTLFSEEMLLALEILSIPSRLNCCSRMNVSGGEQAAFVCCESRGFPGAKDSEAAGLATLVLS